MKWIVGVLISLVAGNGYAALESTKAVLVYPQLFSDSQNYLIEKDGRSLPLTGIAMTNGASYEVHASEKNLDLYSSNNSDRSIEIEYRCMKLVDAFSSRQDPFNSRNPETHVAFCPKGGRIVITKARNLVRVP